MPRPTLPCSVLAFGFSWVVVGLGGPLPAQVEQLDLVEEPQEIDDSNTYFEYGALLPVELGQVGNPTGQRLPLIWIAPDGKIVEKGTLVAELDPGPLQSELDPARVGLETARARLAAAEAGLQAARESSEGVVHVAERALALAAEARERLDRDELALEIRGIEGELRVADKRLEVAHRRVERLKKLPTTVEIEERIEAAEIAALEALTQIELSRARLELVTKSAGAFKAAERELDIAQHKLELRRARTEGALAVRRAEAEVAASRTEREVEARRLARLEDAIAACKIVAPAAGRLVSVSSPSRSEARGAPLSTDVVLYKVVDPNRFRLELITPLDVAQRVSTGQTVKVTVDAFPDATFQGRITSIGVERASTGGPASRRTTRTATTAPRILQRGRVEIHLDDPDGRLRASMTAGVALELAKP